MVWYSIRKSKCVSISQRAGIREYTLYIQSVLFCLVINESWQFYPHTNIHILLPLTYWCVVHAVSIPYHPQDWGEEDDEVYGDVDSGTIVPQKKPVQQHHHHHHDQQGVFGRMSLALQD